MKNKLYQALLLIFLVAGISSCDYLDIVLMNVRLRKLHLKIKMQLNAICILVMLLCPKNAGGAIYIKEVIVLPIMTGNFLRNPYRGQYR